MILLPRSWTLQRTRAITAGASWLLLAVGGIGVYHEACEANGWGSILLIWLGIVMLTLLAATEPGIALQKRFIRLVLGGLMLFPVSLVLVGLIQETVRSTCSS